ncbi:hypothetical protein [Streptomyces beigongshangae]|uniref:hypothetical protein n=1 Tax=Streptomyces beigongshangae TaxID=2841597 RepID=UPI001C84CA54|nr:hypothetical protein [Streptomyces sp. REN17]
MKSLKAAAVVAGSMAVAGVAAPALAADMPPTSLNGGVNSAVPKLLYEPVDVMPLKSQSRALDTENEGSILSAFSHATDALNAAGGPTGLLGGLPLGK